MPIRIAWRICGEDKTLAASWQVSGYMAAVCKTIGSAYVGSNLTPATHVMSQDIEDTVNPRKGRGVFFGQPDGLPVGW